MLHPFIISAIFLMFDEEKSYKVLTQLPHIDRLQYVDALKPIKRHPQNRVNNPENCDNHWKIYISCSMQWACSNRIMHFRNDFNWNIWSPRPRSIASTFYFFSFSHQIEYTFYEAWTSSYNPQQKYSNIWGNSCQKTHTKCSFMK